MNPKQTTKSPSRANVASQLLSKIDLTAVRPLLQETGWYCDDRRYFAYALSAWEQVVELTRTINQSAPVARTVRAIDEPQLYEILRKREFWSDCVKIYSAMAVEAWINFYGVAKLTEPIFAKHLERQPIPIKLRVLLELTSAKHSPLIELATRIANRRNALVHPKTIEMGTRTAPTEPMPGTAYEALSDAISFFRDFVVAVPEAESQVPPDAATPLTPIPNRLRS